MQSQVGHALASLRALLNPLLTACKGPGSSRDDSDESVITRINGYFRKYMQPDKETLMGEILGWQLRFQAVAREQVGKHQATWDRDGLGLTYNDVHLRLDDVRQLFASTLAHAQQLLYGELSGPMEAIRGERTERSRRTSQASAEERVRATSTHILRGDPPVERHEDPPVERQEAP